ncbi:MAG: protein kinase [Acidobacteria bacterium]|nr:protein kinase [Acidobacteriota bacterium]
MTKCMHCGAQVPDGARFCAACGAPVSSISQMPTAASRAVRPKTPASASRPPSSGSYDAAFAPGEVLAERYRIVGLLGRGGMGEVYRADDLKLGQPVALKFLPRQFCSDPALLERFHSEVRNARQVSHPHVCRVYDIGEVDGHHFLSMEYVDGEDLATLLRRIGRLPPAKAVEIARQLCAGLAAAHERGVLHRDLKPANIMLDGHGRARITDFGLAVRSDEAAGEIAGTPAYMSPEQLTGQPATAQSDIYSLGLVLYEIYTGKKTFEASSFAEWRRKHTEDLPTNPSLHTADLDPAAARVILRCLEKDPAKRPASASQVAMALPGGDPLAAAIAAGETPSPEMVAAAGGESALPLRVAWPLLGGVLLLMAAVIVLAPYATDMGLSRWEKSPAVLRERAREIATRFGYQKDPADSTFWIDRDYDPMRYLASNKPAPGWRKLYRDLGPPMTFGYRQSPRPLAAPGAVDVRADTPPLDVSGMVNVYTDTQGHLRGFRAVPPQIEPEKKTAAAEFDWASVFTEAGLDPARFQKTEPKWIPAVPFDTRAEWTGSIPEIPDLPLTVSAAAFRGKLVSFEIRGPWSKPERMEAPNTPLGLRIGQMTLTSMFVGLGIAAIFFARRNLRQGRGDRKGALRISTFMFAASVLVWAVTNHHPPDVIANLTSASIAMAIGLLSAGFIWLTYLAVEPYLRRRMPELLIGWARLLEGRFRDPRVGRDILIGAIGGTVIALIAIVVNGLSTWFAFQGQTTIPAVAVIFTGVNPLSYLFLVTLASVTRALGILALYFVFRVLLRKPALAVVALGILPFLINLGGENAALEIPGAVLGAVLMTWLVTRIGLLAVVAMWCFDLLLTGVAPSLDFSSWYAAYTMPALVFLLALALYAFYISLGNQPMFGAASLED